MGASDKRIVQSKRWERQVLSVEDFTEVDLEAIRNAKPTTGASFFNHEAMFYGSDE
jgi:hypothetical protein